MIYDLDRNICAIKYNLLNLPDTIQFANGNLIVHQYDALGNKYSTTYYTRNTPIVVPIGNIVEQLSSEYNKQHYVYNDNVTYRKLTSTQWRIERVDNVEGYVGYDVQRNNYFPYYYIKDYLGNVRETYMQTISTASQRVQYMQYYPSGLPWNDNYQSAKQPYKYGGKEFVEMHGLDEYDSQARWYYPALMRTTTQDPFAEKYYDISPYAWCANNPVNLVDPEGKDIFEINDKGEIVNVEECEAADIFFVHEKNKDNELKFKGSISFEYGTVQKHSYLNENKEHITWFKINNKKKAAELFKFFADNLQIEFGLVVTNTKSFVMTMHSYKEVAVTFFAMHLESYDYNVTNIIHNHPRNSGPSGFEKQKDGDAKAAYYFFSRLYRRNINLYVYRSKQSGSLTKYDQNSIGKTFPWSFFYKNLNR